MPWRLRHFLLTVEAECLYYNLFLMALNDKCQKQVILQGNVFWQILSLL